VNSIKCKVASKFFKDFLAYRKLLLAHGNQQKFHTKMICEMAFFKQLFCHSREKAVRKYADEIDAWAICVCIYALISKVVF
jgi:hypothetical protein